MGSVQFTRRRNLPHTGAAIMQLLNTITYIYQALKGQCSGDNILLVASSAVMSGVNKLFSKYHVKAVSTIIDSTTK